MAPQSLKDRVQARRKALQANHTKTFDVPGYEGILKARYRVLTLKEMTRAENRADNEKVDEETRTLYMFADVLVAACDAVLDAETDEPAVGGKWSAALAEDLGFDVKTPRQAVLAIIERELVLTNHYREMRAWQEGAVALVDEELAGESEPPQSSS